MGRKDRKDIKSCRIKVRYEDQEAAKKSAAMVPHFYLREYPCRFCAGWHLTKTVENKPK